MSGKPIQFVVLFSTLFAVLIGIQIHFLMNSYSLKKREIFAQVKSQLNDLEDDLDIFDDELVKDDDALARFIQLENQSISETKLRAEYKVLADHIQPSLTRYLDSVFAPLGYQVSVRKEFTSVYSQNSKRELIRNPILIYQSTSELKKKQILSSGRWETSTNTQSIETKQGEEKETLSRYYGYNVKRISYFEISNLETILFREMRVLIIISVFILVAILILFYKSYKNLLEQKRQIENLHDMVDNVSHELRTPVGTLKVVASTLEKLFPSPTVQVLGRQVDRLEQILGPLNEQFISESGNFFSKEDLHSHLEDFQFLNPSVSITANQFPTSDLNIIKEDMETILSNLLGNSVKYGADRIELRFSSDSNLFKITIQDNGKGINKKDQPYIFEKFYRIQKDNIHQTKGMGLGLYVVRRILEKYEGKISVMSAPYHGALFQIAIPYE